MTSLPQLHDQPSNGTAYEEVITRIRSYDFSLIGVYTFDELCQIHHYVGMEVDNHVGEYIYTDGVRTYWKTTGHKMYIYPTIPLNVGKNINLFDIIVKNDDIHVNAPYCDTVIYSCCKFLKRLFGGEESCWLIDDINYMLEYMGKQPIDMNPGSAYVIIDDRISEQPFEWMSEQCSPGTTERLYEEELDENIISMVTTPGTLKERQTRAIGYLYIRTYDSWFGYVFSPFNNEVISTDRDCDRILYCKVNDTTVISTTSAESESGYDFTEYKHLYYGTETEPHPIGHFSPVNPSQEDRMVAFKNVLSTLKTDLDSNSSPTTLGDDIQNMFNSIHEITIRSMVTEMITITPEPHVDWYLRDSLKVILGELDFFYECIQLFMTPSEQYLSQSELDELNRLIPLYSFQTYLEEWPELRNRLVHIENDLYEWYPGATGRAQQSLRLALWSEISASMPNISQRNMLDTFEKGYTQYYNRGIIYTENASIYSVLSDEHAIPTGDEQDAPGYYVRERNNERFTLGKYDDMQWSDTRYIYTVNIENIKMMYVLWSYLGNQLLCSLQLFPWYTGIGFYFLQRDSQIIMETARFCISDTMDFESDQNRFMNQIMHETIKSEARTLDIHLIYGLYNLLEKATPSEWNTYSRYIPLLRRSDFDIEITSRENMFSTNVFLSYCEPDTEYCMEYRELAAQSFTELSETQIKKNNTVYKKVILMKLGNSYLPWLQFNWGSIVPEEYTGHVIETPDASTMDKATYVQFMTSTIIVQMTVLRQLITIADECIKIAVTETAAYDQYTLYRLESYGITEISQFASVVTKMTENEQVINTFIQNNLDRIKELLPQESDESEAEWLSRITGGRSGIPDYTSGIGNALEGIYTDNQIYERINSAITNSKFRRERWINLRNGLQYMLTLLFNVLITDIREYSTDIKWIYMTPDSIFMSTEQIEIQNATEYQIIN